MDHHRARRMAEFLHRRDRSRRRRSRRAAACPAMRSGATPAMTAFARGMGLAGGEPHAGRLAAGSRDLGHLGAGEDLAAGRGHHALPARGSWCRRRPCRAPCRNSGWPSIPDRGTPRRRRCRARSRDACPRRQASPSHAADSKFSSSQARGEASSSRTSIERAGDALLAPERSMPVPASARDAHRRAEQPEQMLGLAGKAGDQPAPAVGIGLRRRRRCATRSFRGRC